MRKANRKNLKEADEWNEIDESLIQDLIPHNREVLRKMGNKSSKDDAVLKDKEIALKYDQSCKDRLKQKR